MGSAVSTVGIAGLGLIGASLALALRRAGFAERYLGWDADEQVCARACELSLVDDAAGDLRDLAARCDLLVIATPTRAAEDLLRALLESAAAGGPAPWLTDVASVKGPLCRIASAAPPAAGRRFIPGHPIAGSERSGVDAGNADLFAAHRVILTPLADTAPEGLALVRSMWEAAGALVETLDVDEHDTVLAATSHLPHAVAFALVNALAASDRSAEIFRFAAGGFRDFTRIASSDPIMWRDISVSNAPALLEAIDGFAAELASLRAAVAEGDADAIESTYRAAKRARDQFASDLEARLAGRAADGD